MKTTLKFFVKTMLSFSADYAKVMLTTPSSISSLTCWCMMLTCSIHDMVVMVLTIGIAPIFSTLTMTGSSTTVFVLLNNWIKKINSFTASDYIHLAFELNSLMHCCILDCQDSDLSNTYISDRTSMWAAAVEINAWQVVRHAEISHSCQCTVFDDNMKLNLLKCNQHFLITNVVQQFQYCIKWLTKYMTLIMNGACIMAFSK